MRMREDSPVNKTKKLSHHRDSVARLMLTYILSRTVCHISRSISGLLHDVFWSFMIFKRDECIRTVFIPLHKAISNLLCQFYDYVFSNV